MKKTELLAPAKDLETAKLAIDCGADAVYIGGPSFGARYKAGNSLEDLKELVQYAHKFYVKIYVTVNTIVTDIELDEVKELIKKLYEIGVDGIIVQDMGILKLAIDKQIPPIPLHISTQCDNRFIEKVKFFEEMGIPRVVLARELSLDEIRKIKNNTNVELECFIHGALCVSYSGQCYLSQCIGGRSANRGECAQPCRKKYSLIDDKGNVIAKDKHLLSTKDFNATKHLKEMVDIGVKSFKIEGRLKDTDYVKNVVLYYRKELDKICGKTSSGTILTNFEPNITKSFNRGYTDYFLEKRKDCFNFDTPKGQYLGKVTKIGKNFFETDTKENINPQDGLSIGEEGCLVNKVEGKKIFPNKMPEIKVNQKVFRNKDAQYEKELNNAKVKRQIQIDIEVKDGKIWAIDEDNNKTFVEIESTEKANNQDKMNQNFITQMRKTGDSDFTVNNIELDSDIPFMPVSSVNELRRTLLDKLMQARLNNYKREEQTPLRYVDYYKQDDDYRANVYNNEAKEFYKHCNCEITEPAYEMGCGHQIELMRTKHCIKYALNMCKSPQKLFLVDDRNKKYELQFDCKNCEMVIVG